MIGRQCGIAQPTSLSSILDKIVVPMPDVEDTGYVQDLYFKHNISRVGFGVWFGAE